LLRKKSEKKGSETGSTPGVTRPKGDKKKKKITEKPLGENEKEWGEGESSGEKFRNQPAENQG